MRASSMALLGLVAGVGVGVIVDKLHAQANPPVYFIAENEVADAEGYKKDYLPLAQASIKQYGGRYLAAGNATPLAGDPPKSRVVILVWESMDKLNGWFNSPEYKEARAIGLKYAKYRNYAIPGVAQ